MFLFFFKKGKDLVNLPQTKFLFFLEGDNLIDPPNTQKTDFKDHDVVHYMQFEKNPLSIQIPVKFIFLLYIYNIDYWLNAYRE